MAISITRALTEIKNLDDQINKAVASSVFCNVTKGQGDRKTVAGTSRSVQAAEASAKAAHQKITDLIKRRQSLKAAVQASNAHTMVTIANVQMLVADAIERKNSIKYEVDLHNVMRSQYVGAVNNVEKLNATLNQQVETAVTQAYGNDKGKVTEEQYAAVAAPRLKENEAAVLDPLNLAETLEMVHDKINGFLMEVDFVLSESNARTQVEV